MNSQRSKAADSTNSQLNWLDEVHFNQAGLVPAIAQDSNTNEVLMVAWMNREALKLTAEKNQAVYFSRSRNKLWHKGESSGHFQIVKELRLDCDADVIMLMVEQQGGIACHTGRRSCFYRKLIDGEWQVVEKVLKDPSKIYGDAKAGSDKEQSAVQLDSNSSTSAKVENIDVSDTLTALTQVLKSRKSADADSSYVASLYTKGLNKILEKIGEESIEVILAAKELQSQDQIEAQAHKKCQNDLVYEVADLWFHVLVMLTHFNIEPDAILAELARRFGVSGIDEKNARTSK